MTLVYDSWSRKEVEAGQLPTLELSFFKVKQIFSCNLDV